MALSDAGFRVLGLAEDNIWRTDRRLAVDRLGAPTGAPLRLPVEPPSPQPGLPESALASGGARFAPKRQYVGIERLILARYAPCGAW